MGARRLSLIAGFAVLALAWGGPLPGLSAHSFAAHMTLHMSVVALAAPLIALGIAGSPFDPSSRLPRLFSPLVAAMLEFAVIWGWHMPALHHAARASVPLFIVEQGSFLLAGLLLWLSCFGGAAAGRAGAALVGTLGLLLTSMHMTLLGALIAFATRPLYAHGAHANADVASALADQQLGGVIMLLAGGLVYLAGGLALMARVVGNAAPQGEVPR
ncbi:cytochrome c oxidase assembly protein [Starkeya koreensis]|uniref:Cytochrome c oxidase assembly protein n=1 Tax=Ancylobacter koreensis TaxID=266121 RepID=A0ABT0DL95_9HYPH|nr:cytochrome c oxidase assembly protein [Ancylobacter koreensis]MCK0207949.1 cytochrome c oxidase assembly protein [Ancylobacter koreensis]